MGSADIELINDVRQYRCEIPCCLEPSGARQYYAKASDGDHTWEGRIKLCDYHAQKVASWDELTEDKVLQLLQRNGSMMPR